MRDDLKGNLKGPEKLKKKKLIYILNIQYSIISDMIGDSDTSR